MHVGFLYNAHLHQIPHSAPIAFELSSRHPTIRVSIIVQTPEHLAFVDELAAQYPDHRCDYRVLNTPRLLQHIANILNNGQPLKHVVLAYHRTLFSKFDALVVPERTSLFLKKLWLRRVKLIHSDHGAGDRAIGFEPRIRKFDFVLVAGQKQRDRMLQLGLIQPGRYAVAGYCKFDRYSKNGRNAHRLFPNSNITVLYAPHFRPQFSSWERMGLDILDFFSRTPEYNLIFAPHIRLFYRASQSRKDLLFKTFNTVKNIHIDLGSRASGDMTYTNAADIYLGDVSSQVYEFLLRPRPCIFLDANQVAWNNDPHYLCWRCGPVLRDIRDLESSLAQAMETHAQYIEVQKALFQYTFDLSDESSGARGADAIASYLARSCTKHPESREHLRAG